MFAYARRRAGGYLKAAAFSSTAAAAIVVWDPATIRCDGELSDAEQKTRGIFATVAVAANAPREDRASHGFVGNSAFFFLMLDGHGGWQTAEYAQNNLIDFVRQEGIVEATNCKEKTSALVRGFEKCDESWKSLVSQAFNLGFGQTARVGACALLAYIDNKNDTLHVACAGDCQAVLGTGTNARAVPMSEEHNARVKKEAARIFREHPGEPDAVRCKPGRPDACYVKGRLQPTRCLGDLYLKDVDFNGPPYQRDGKFVDRTRGRHIPAPYTPPYITATPTVTSRKLQSDDRFLILATDGLWDYVSQEEAVAVASATFDQNSGTETPQSQITKSRGGDGEDDEEAIVGANPLESEIHACCRSTAEKLIAMALQRAAKQRGLEVEDLLGMSLGKKRRACHDDITVTVVSLAPCPPTVGRSLSSVVSYLFSGSGN